VIQLRILNRFALRSLTSLHKFPRETLSSCTKMCILTAYDLCSLSNGSISRSATPTSSVHPPPPPTATSIGGGNKSETSASVPTETASTAASGPGAIGKISSDEIDTTAANAAPAPAPVPEGSTATASGQPPVRRTSVVAKVALAITRRRPSQQDAMKKAPGDTEKVLEKERAAEEEQRRKSEEAYAARHSLKINVSRGSQIDGHPTYDVSNTLM
jgi:hypothetical protein